MQALGMLDSTVGHGGLDLLLIRAVEWAPSEGGVRETAMEKLVIFEVVKQLLFKWKE